MHVSYHVHVTPQLQHMANQAFHPRVRYVSTATAGCERVRALLCGEQMIYMQAEVLQPSIEGA